MATDSGEPRSVSRSDELPITNKNPKNSNWYGRTQFGIFVTVLVVSFIVGRTVEPSWSIDKVALDTHTDEIGTYYIFRGEPKYVEFIPIEDAFLNPDREDELAGDIPSKEEFVVEDGNYYQLVAQQHWGIWSLLPAFVAVLLCWLTREPATALFAGILSGSFLLTRYDFFDEVLIPELATVSAASIIVLYLWLLGGLMGTWSRTGAAQAFATLMTEKVVRGPRTAKLVAWMLGVIFFQGGTVSTVLVGSTVKPIADKENVSHEELSYIVDSTASPIASQLAFNAWPGYVQAFIFVAGCSFLATEADRLKFFYTSVPFCFYALFAVMGTFLLSIEKPLFLGPSMKRAMDRARTTGELDAPDAQVLASKELQTSHVPDHYSPNVWEFFIPLGLLIGIAIGTFVIYGAPKIHWAFGAALLSVSLIALARGLSLRELLSGYEDGFKGVVMGSIILLLAITIGSISKITGGGVYLVDLLGDAIPYYLLPVLLQVMTMIIAFSTGSSWGTYAVAFPLAMPLAWAITSGNDLTHPWLFMTLCFAAVMDGSVYGDQCSPISDTTVLSSVCTGCDLMDHVRTQIPQATFAAILAAFAWTLVAYFIV